jgi:uncharacterized protein involved in response to NO
MFAAIKFGSFGLLLPVYFTVNHRMTPFFASCVYPAYASWRPMWILAAFWALVLCHLGLELVHGYAWLWLPDLPLAAFAGHAVVEVVAARQGRPDAGPCCACLLLGFAWLPLAFAMYSVQSLWFAGTGEWAYARAPAHALYIGYFGSLLVAMVTRVTQGHFRPAALNSAYTATFAFALVQLCAPGAHRREGARRCARLAVRRRRAVAACLPALGAALGGRLPASTR